MFEKTLLEISIKNFRSSERDKHDKEFMPFLGYNSLKANFIEAVINNKKSSKVIALSLFISICKWNKFILSSSYFAFVIWLKWLKKSSREERVNLNYFSEHKFEERM